MPRKKPESQHLQLTLELQTEKTPGLILLAQPGYWDLLHPSILGVIRQPPSLAALWCGLPHLLITSVDLTGGLREPATLGRCVQLPAPKCREELGTGTLRKGWSAATMSHGRQPGRTMHGFTCSGKSFSCFQRLWNSRSHLKLQKIQSPGHAPATGFFSTCVGLTQ